MTFKNFTLFLFACLIGFSCLQSCEPNVKADPPPVEIPTDDPNLPGFGDWEIWNDDFKNVRWSKEINPKGLDQKVHFQMRTPGGIWENVQDEPFEDYGSGWQVVEKLLEKVNETSSNSKPYKVSIEEKENGCT